MLPSTRAPPPPKNEITEAFCVYGDASIIGKSSHTALGVIILLAASYSLLSGYDKMFVTLYNVQNVFVVAPGRMSPTRTSSNKANEVVIAEATLAQIGVAGSTVIVLSVYKGIVVS